MVKNQLNRKPYQPWQIEIRLPKKIQWQTTILSSMLLQVFVYLPSVYHFSTQSKSLHKLLLLTNQQSQSIMVYNINSNKVVIHYLIQKLLLMPSHFSIMPYLTHRKVVFAEHQRILVKVMKTLLFQKIMTGELNIQNVFNQL